MRFTFTLVASLGLIAILALSGGCSPAAHGNPSGSSVASPAPVSSPAAPEQSPAAAPASAAPTAPAATGTKRTFTISPYSSITWAAFVTIGGREGGFSTFGGTVEMEGDNFESINVNATIDMTSVFSDATELTKKLKGEENFFNPVKWPASTFKSTSVKKAGDHYDVTGDLSLRDKTKSITFPATISLEGSSLKVTAELQLNRQDFDITYQSTIGDYVIKDMATVKLDITAEPASGAASGSALAPAA